MHFEELLAKNHELSELVGTLRGEIATLSTTSVSLLGSVDKSDRSVTFCFQRVVKFTHLP